MSGRTTVVVAALCGASAVIIGAFGAHWLPSWLQRQDLEPALAARRLENLETGARYHMYHALALFGVGILMIQSPLPLGRNVPWVFLLGILLFSGCLYAYALTGLKFFAMLVPLGGLSFILGWIWLALAVRRGVGS